MALEVCEKFTDFLSEKFVGTLFHPSRSPSLSVCLPPCLSPSILVSVYSIVEEMKGRKTLCWLLIAFNPLFQRLRPAEGNAWQQLAPEPPPEAAALQQTPAAAAASPVQLWSLPAFPAKPGKEGAYCKDLTCNTGPF